MKNEVIEKLEPYVIGLLTKGSKIEEIRVIDLQSQFSDIGYQECAAWLFSFKEKHGVNVDTTPPEWFSQWTQQLAQVGLQLWPMLSEHFQVEAAKAVKDVQSRCQELESNLTDAIQQVSQLEGEKADLQGKLNGKESECNTLQQSLTQLNESREEINGLHQQQLTSIQQQLETVTEERDILKTNNIELAQSNSDLEARVPNC